MKFFDLLQKRRSVRDFVTEEVSDEDVKKIIQAAKTAPSAGGLQSYEIIEVHDSDTKSKLAKASLHQTFIAQVPIVLVFCADVERSASKYGDRGRDLYSLQDATIAAAYAQLAVTDLGLASVWVGAFSEEEVSEILNLENHLRPICILPVGKER